MRPTMRKRIAVQAPTCIELLAWHPASEPPDDERTVLGRAAGADGSWPMYYGGHPAQWHAFGGPSECFDLAGRGITVLAWSEMPQGGQPGQPTLSAEALNGRTVVAALTKCERGYLDLQFTAAGKALPPGTHQLCALPAGSAKG